MITEVFLPQLTSTMEEGLIVEWLKSEGEAVAADEPLVQVETDKAIMEIESPAEGILLRILAEVGESCAVLAPIGLIGEAGDDVTQYQPAGAPEAIAAPSEAAPLPAAAVAAPVAAETERLAASPRARRLAEELGVNLASVTGTGPGGRITEEDVRQAAATVLPAPGAPAAQVVPLTGMRKAVAAWMVKSKQEIPHFYLTSHLDMAAAAQLLADLKPRFAAEGVKLTYTALLVKATALVLREVPELNAWCTGEGLQVLPEINVGVAIAARQGIVVPVLRQAPERSLLDLAGSLQDLAEHARTGALPAEAFGDRSFTLSNLGGFPVDQFAAIINPPEVGILAMGRVQEAAVVREGQVVVRPQLTVTLSCDHRAVDGVTGAVFLQRLGEVLQEPEALV